MDNEEKTFKVCITETLEKVVEIEASDAKEAMRNVRNLYYHEDIILMSEDLTNVDFSIMEGSD
jgi:hypothetical protein